MYVPIAQIVSIVLKKCVRAGYTARTRCLGQTCPSDMWENTRILRVATQTY